MADMGTVQFWSDHRNKKAPKPLKREPKWILLPSYVFKQLKEHSNTFVHQDYPIEDVIHTLLKKHNMICSYSYDGDNGYIIVYERHK